ncbi:MAG: copper-binding protein [Burkholderiales bacterium]|jgi:Cu(I)/Ag(I) efflux system protein CusF|nr:copper-binding protein [Burkholderiales bacterium]
MDTHHLILRRAVVLSLSALALSFSIAPAGAQINSHANHDCCPQQQQAEKNYSTSGVVKSLQPEKKRAMIEHDAIPELKWPVMNMPFEVPDATLLNDLKVGARIDFTFKIDANGRSILLTAKPKG